MAGSLDGRARRVRKLEGLDCSRVRAGPSRAELEAWALNAEIREIEAEMRTLGMDPYKWRLGDDLIGLPPDEHIAELEKELEQ